MSARRRAGRTVIRQRVRASGSAHVNQVAGDQYILVSSDEGPKSSDEIKLDEVSERLAQAVRVEWQREEDRRRLHDPFPLPIRFRRAPKRFFDRSVEIGSSSNGPRLGPLQLAGTIGEIVDVYRRVPSRRLVILGEPGSGKSVLAVRFLLDWLSVRRRADPVPVILSAGSWNPRATSLSDWICNQLIRNYPGLAARPSADDRATWARKLIDARRILPIIDGFDEIAEGLHRDALRALNVTSMPLLITSRPTEYASAISVSKVLTAGAAIRLERLTIRDISDYLRYSSRPNLDGDITAEANWDRVLERLGTQPATPVTRNLMETLSSPLMVSLARTVYNDSPGPDPDELLDIQRFPTIESVQAHLLNAFIPATYDHPPLDRHGVRPAVHDWDAQRAQRWLAYVAVHLTRLKTRDLALWELGRSSTPLTRFAVMGEFVGALLTVLVGSSVALIIGIKQSLIDGWDVGLLAGLIGGALAGVLGGVGRGSEPSLTRLNILGQRRRLKKYLVVAICCGLIGGFASALLHPIGGLAGAIAFSMTLSLSGVLLMGLESPVDLGAEVSPTRLLATDRRKTIFQVSVLGALVGISVALIDVRSGKSLVSASDGLESTWVAGLAFALSTSAWGRWLAFGRVWLPLMGRLPRQTVTFLDDACFRGVLRQVGPIYQFRHAHLQEYLAKNDGVDFDLPSVKKRWLGVMTGASFGILQRTSDIITFLLVIATMQIAWSVFAVLYMQIALHYRSARQLSQRSI